MAGAGASGDWAGATVKSVERWTDEELLDRVLEDARYRLQDAPRTMAENEILRRLQSRMACPKLAVGTADTEGG